MEISLDLMLESLDTSEWIEACCHQKSISYSDSSIREVALLPSNISFLDKGILWCGLLAHILTLSRELRSGCSFLAFGTEEEFEEISKANDCNCIFFPQHSGVPSILPDIFNEAARVICRFNDWEHRLDLAIANGKKIQDLIDICESVIKNPFVVWNPSFEIVAYSKNIPIPRPQMQRILQEGRFSGDDIEHVTRMGYLKDTDKYSKLTLCYPPNWMDCPFALRVYTEEGSTVVSMVNYFMYTLPTVTQIELLYKFESKMNLYVKSLLQTGVRRKSLIYEPILIDLIEGRLTDVEEIADRLKAIKIPFKGMYRMYQIKFEKYTSSLDHFTRLRFKSIFPMGKIVHYRDNLFVLNKEDDIYNKPESEEYVRSNLDKLLEVCSAWAGVSDIVSDLSNIRSIYLQTESALRIGSIIGNDERIWDYSDTAFFDMVSFYSSQSGIAAEQFCYLPLNILIEKDRASDNNNLQLLDSYLNNDRNITFTAKQLNLHRNSVIYRIERIEQMLGGSLNDPDLRFKLLVSLKIIRFIELQNKAQIK